MRGRERAVWGLVLLLVGSWVVGAALGLVGVGLALRSGLLE